MHPTPHTWKEARRLQAWHLKPRGWSQRQMAEALGVSEGAVSQWMTRACDAGPAAAVSRPTRPPARAVAAWARSLWLSWSAVDPYAHRRRHPPGVWCLLSSAPCGPRVPRHALDPATAHPPRPPARRRGHCPVARRDLAGPQQGAEAQEQPLLFIGESGFSPLPSVVRTDAPVGQPPSYGTGAPAIISRP
jgi:Homeodomain-like domain-containing protein